MTTETATRETFCTKCTRLAPIHQLTIDARYPMVKCTRTDRDGQEHGCGIVPGTYDEAEAVAVVRERKRVLANAHHKDHLAYKKPNALCDECKVKPPVKPVAVHPFESWPRKYRTAAHLEMIHHDRGMLPRLPLRSAQELEDYHRGLHAAPALTRGAR